MAIAPVELRVELDVDGVACAACTPPVTPVADALKEDVVLNSPVPAVNEESLRELVVALSDPVAFNVSTTPPSDSVALEDNAVFL